MSEVIDIREYQGPIAVGGVRSGVHVSTIAADTAGFLTQYWTFSRVKGYGFVIVTDIGAIAGSHSGAKVGLSAEIYAYIANGWFAITRKDYARYLTEDCILAAHAHAPITTTDGTPLVVKG